MEVIAIVIGTLIGLTFGILFTALSNSHVESLVAECDARGGIVLKGYMPLTGKDAIGCFDIKNLELTK